MSQAELSVNFKSVGASQLKSELQGVGSAAQSSSGQIKSASTATEGLGKGMKGSVASIGQVATAFATLSLSIVNAYRSYRDLGDAQLAVDRANLKVSKTQNAIRLLEKDIAKDRKEGAKGSLDYAIASNKIVQAEQKLSKDRKDGKHSAAELKGEELAIAKMRKDGVGNTQQLTDKETKLNLLREQLGIATTNAGEAQERFNDIQQNFYLSIAPLAISTIGTLATTFGTLKTSIGGAGVGGIIGSLGGLGLVLGGLSLGVIAYQNNWLGLKDKIGGVITWVKDRIGLWKQGFEDVFSFIKKGDWGGAFNRIIQAAAAVWQDLKKTFPLLTAVETVVNAIRAGNWKYAFSTIVAAADVMWLELKKKVPLLGGVETLVMQLSQAKWGDAWNTIKQGAITFWNDLVQKVPFLGDLATYLRTKLELAAATAKAQFNMLKNTLLAPGGAISLIQAGLDKLGKGDIVGGFSGIAAGLKKGITDANLAFNAWVLSNFGINLGTLETQAMAIGNTILTKIKEGLTFVARTWIDPIVTALLTPETWTTAFIALGGAVVTIGTAVWNFIAGAIAGAAADPKGATSYWATIGEAIWTGIADWFQANLPSAKKAAEGLAKAFVDAFNSTGVWFQNIGIGIWNQIIDGLEKAVPVDFGNAIKGWLESQKKKPIEITASVTADTKPADSLINKWTGNVQKIKPRIPITADTSQALKLAKQAQARIDDMRATINVSPNFIGFGHGAGLNFASGTSMTVRKPTTITVGEGGREEHVSVTPIGSTGHSGDSGGGFSGTINVYVDGVLRPARYDMGARK